MISQKAWQLIAESKISAAIDAGEFDNLPGFGKPLDPEYFQADENWWLKAKAKREKLSLLPPALALKAQVERRLTAIGRMDSELEVRSALEQLNLQIETANRQIVWGPPSEVFRLDVERLLQGWREKRED